MTEPCTETLESEKDKLFVTDAELVRRLGVPAPIARAAIRGLDDNPRSGFPPKSDLWGNRRYWPAVLDWLDRSNGISGIGAARVAPENPHRSGPPRRLQPAEPMRKVKIYG